MATRPAGTGPRARNARRGPLPPPPLLLLALALAFGGSAPLAAQDASDPSPWLAWVGCWESEGTEATGDGGYLLCVTPIPSGGGLEIRSYEGGTLLLTEELRPDGPPIRAEEEGCLGVQQATTSADGARIFLHSELTCGGEFARETQGTLALLPGGQGWLEVQAVRHGEWEEEPLVGIRSFRPASPTLLASLALPDPTAGLSLAIASARARAGRPLSAEALIELSQRAGSAVAAAFLLARDERMEVSSATLRTLSRGGVSGEVLDLLVALQYPERFDVRPTGEVAQVEPGRSASSSASYGVGYGRSALAPWPGRPQRGYSPWGLTYLDVFWMDAVYVPRGFGGYSYYPGYLVGGQPWGVPPVLILDPIVVRDRSAPVDRNGGVQNPGSGPATRQAQPRSGQPAPSNSGAAAQPSPTPAPGNTTAAPAAAPDGRQARPRTENDPVQVR